MAKKIYQLIFGDGHIRLRLMILLVFVILGFSQIKILGAQQRKITRMEEEKKTKEFERVLREVDSHRIEAPQKSNEEHFEDLNLVFEGSISEKDDFFALINGEIYKKGDLIGGYLIDTISKATVTLRKPQTDQIHLIYLENLDDLEQP